MIDATPAWEEHRQVVDAVLAELGALDSPVLHVFNKSTGFEQATLAALQERVNNLLPNSVFVSATSDEGLEPLRRALLASIDAVDRKWSFASMPGTARCSPRCIARPK